nr:hypothetical protein CFP56_53704 [Quercus suber]
MHGYTFSSHRVHVALRLPQQHNVHAQHSLDAISWLSRDCSHPSAPQEAERDSSPTWRTTVRLLIDLADTKLVDFGDL